MKVRPVLETPVSNFLSASFVSFFMVIPPSDCCWVGLTHAEVKIERFLVNPFDVFHQVAMIWIRSNKRALRLYHPVCYRERSRNNGRAFFISLCAQRGPRGGPARKSRHTVYRKNNVVTMLDVTKASIYASFRINLSEKWL